MAARPDLSPTGSSNEGRTIAVRALDKCFGATQALSRVSVGFEPGEITGLVGSNGAGKSTLIRVLAGIVPPDSGSIVVDGEDVVVSTPLVSRRLGIEVVHQNVDDLVTPGLSVAENLILDSLGAPGSPWFVSRQRINKRAEKIADAIGGLGLDLDRAVENCTVSERQMVAIARALHHRPRLLILDEPTAALSDAEAQRLFRFVREIASTGVAVVFVSHHLQEIEQLCDRVVVMRDGAIVLTDILPIERSDMVEAMLGRSVTKMQVSQRTAGETVARLDGVSCFEDSPPMTIEFRTNEVVGLFGLIGAGKTELLQQLFGLTPLISGHMDLRGDRFEPLSPRDAIDVGVVYVPEERGALALIGDWSVADNIALPYLESFEKAPGLLSRKKISDAVEPVIDLMGIKCESGAVSVSTLSGGNQQKVVVGRWMQESVNVMVLDEPFRGIDIGARHDIARLLREASQDTGVVFASADPEEILEVADRVIVLADGAVVADMSRHDLSSDELVRLAAA